MVEFISKYLGQLSEALALIDTNSINSAIDILSTVKQRKGIVYIAGNGGSASTASHMVNDLMKIGGVKAIALTDNVALLTAFANDESYSVALKRVLKLYNPLISVEDGKDALILISTSGESDNIFAIMETAYSSNIIVLTGDNKNSKLSKGVYRGWGDAVIHAPTPNQGQQEDIHLILNHIFAQALARL